MTWEIPGATVELCPVVSIRQTLLRDYGVARQNLVCCFLWQGSEGSWAPGQRAHLSWPKFEVGVATSTGHLEPLP